MVQLVPEIEAWEKQNTGFADTPFTVDLTGCRVHIFNTLAVVLIAVPLIRKAGRLNTEGTEKGHRVRGGTTEGLAAGGVKNSNCFSFSTNHGSTMRSENSTGHWSGKGQLVLELYFQAGSLVTVTGTSDCRLPKEIQFQSCMCSTRLGTEPFLNAFPSLPAARPRCSHRGHQL